MPPRPKAYTEAHLMDMIEMKTKYKRKIIRDVLEAFHEFMPMALTEIGIVRILGFGTYRLKEYPEHTYSHPKTQVLTKAPARKVIKFTMDKGGKRTKTNKRGSRLK